MSGAPVTLDDMVSCIVREIGYRKWVYEKRVADKKMTQAKADREIEVMEAILTKLQAELDATPRPQADVWGGDVPR